MQIARFVDAPSGLGVIADVDRRLLTDEIAARRLRNRLSQTLGGVPVLLRCRTGDSFAFDGDLGLRRYAADPMLDLLPAVGIDLEPPVDQAA
jgi:hypothetical protein